MRYKKLTIEINRKENIMTPYEALQKICYTSERTFTGTIYTLADIRYPEYSGRQIKVEINYGKNIFTWLD